MRYLLNLTVAVLLLTPSVSNGQSLDSLVTEALASNPGLASQYKEAEAAIEKVAQVRSLPDPEFSFGYFISPVETRVGPQRARMSLSQMFPWFGSLKNKGDAAALMAEAEYQEFIDARNELVKEVELAYYPMQEIEELIKLEEQFISILETSKELATASFSSGKGALADAIRADIMIDMSSTRIEVLRAKVQPLHSLMKALLDRPMADQLVIDDALEIPSADTYFPLDSALRSNPRLQSLTKRADAQASLAELASKQGLPNFGIGLDYVMVDERADMNVADNGRDVLMPMVKMSIPIWRGKYRAARNEALMREEVITLKRQEAENMLSSRYDRLLFDRIQAREMNELYATQIAKSEQLLDLLSVAYQNSGAEFEEILRTQQDILEYRKAKVGVAKMYHTATSELNYVTAQ